MHPLKKKSKDYFFDLLIEQLINVQLPALLRNGDRNSMRHSVESRVPFLDIDLVNFVISLPSNFKVKKAVRKYILRQVAMKFIPKKLSLRKDKLGLDAPEKSWLKKILGLNVDRTSSKEFRRFIVRRWEGVVEAKEIRQST